MKVFGVNWKTTLHGGIAAFFLWVATDPAIFQKWPYLVSFAKFGEMYGILGMGMFAKDRNVTGGVTPNDRP